MVFQDRWYQEEAVEALASDIIYQKKNDIHPIAVIPTGAGKSVVICKIIDKYLSVYPTKDVLVLSHNEDILIQNHGKLDAYFGDMFLGLYSAGLESREIRKITVAGIQSVYRRAKEFQNVGLVIIDECHKIDSKKDVGMYRKFLSKLNAVFCGLTATPFRTGQGYIYKKYPGFEPLFNKLSYDLSSYENYNRLVAEGYLCPLIPAPTNFIMDTTGIKKSKGDFDESELSDRFDREEVTKKIISNIIKYAGKKYKKWLIFAIDIQHAEHIKSELISRGVTAEVVHSQMERKKSKVLNEYRDGEITALINVNMLTTGLDIPAIDLIAHLRPSMSAIHHVQTNGRGGRPDPSKTHTLVLDYAGNTLTHGPINDIRIVEPGEKKGVGGKVMAKACGNCGTANALKARFCIACEEEFVIDHKLNLSAASVEIIRTQISLQKWVRVDDVSYSITQRKGRRQSLRVMYFSAGINAFSEWVNINQSGYHGARASKWIRNRFTGPAKDLPTTLEKLYAAAHLLRRPSEILVDTSGKYVEIKDFRWDKGDNLPAEINQKVEKEIQIFDDDIPF